MAERKAPPQPQADEKAAEKAEKPAKVKKPFPMKIVIIGGVALAQIVGSFFLQKFLLFPDSSEAGVAMEKPKVEEREEGKVGDEGGMKIVMMDEIIVNPAETGGRRYLAVTLGLQTESPEADKEIETRRALIRDGLITLLSSKSMDQLSNVAYRDSMKHEMLTSVNHQLKHTKVDNIVFSGYVLQ